MPSNHKDEKNENEEHHLQGKGPVRKTRRTFGFRHVQVFLLFLCLTIYYIMRVNLGMAIVVMTDRNNTKHGHAVFDWSTKERGLLLSAFFWGYPFSNLFGGILVTKFSCKTLLMISCLYNATATSLTPWFVSYGGFYLLLAVRASLGCLQGFMMPTVLAQLSRWVPPTERSRSISFVMGGLHIGVILAYSTAGLLGSSAGGWPSIFYLSGALAFAWAVLFYKYGADTPEQCRYVSKWENDLIRAGVQPQSALLKKRIPWKKVLTNKSVWAICIAHTGQNWGYWICISLMPTYMAGVLHYDITNNGLISAMPFVVLWITSFPASFVSDYLIKSKTLSTGNVRKLNNSIGHGGSAIALVSLALTTSHGWAVAMYTLCIMGNAFAFVGYNASPLDVSPNFAGLITGLSNFVSNSSSILAPIFVGYVVTDIGDVAMWRFVFYFSAGIYLIGNTLFVFMASGKIQDFDRTDEPMEMEPRIQPSIK